MKKNIFKLLFISFASINSITYANNIDLNYKNSWLYNFDSSLINRIEIFKDGGKSNLIYKGKEQNIDNFSRNCIGINLTQKNNENLIYKLPDGCNISFLDNVKFNETHSLLMYLCNNKGCEKIDKYSVCIEDNYDDCGF